MKAWVYFDYEYTDLRARRAKDLDLYQYGERQLTKNDIEREEELIDWQMSMQKLVEENPDAKVYIYSGQWGAYWRANSCGYTNKKDKAGIYDINDAWDCVSHVGLEKKISFEIINKFYV